MRRVLGGRLTVALAAAVGALVIMGCPARIPLFQITWIEGDHRDVAVGPVDLGVVEVGSSVDATFEVANTGQEPFRVESIVAVSGSGNGGMEVTQTCCVDFQPGESNRFVVRFSPAEPAEHAATVEVTIEGTDAFIFSLVGTGHVVTVEDQPPAAPSGLAVDALSTTSIRLTWTDNSADETGFRVQRHPEGGAWADVTTVAANTESFDDTGLDPATYYTYQVCATNDVGDSGYGVYVGIYTLTDVIDPTLTVLNIIAGGAVESGFIVGTAADDTAVVTVKVSLDGGPYVLADGTTSWSFALPTGASTWKLGSVHNISVEVQDSSARWKYVSRNFVVKRVNKDVDGDGFVDLVIGAPGDGMGSSVAVADFDADGYADVAVGSYASDTYMGHAGVYYGSAAGLDTAATLLASGPATNSYFGRAMATGDADNDGYADLAVGATGYGTSTGRAYVYHGGSTGIAAAASRTLTGETIGDYFGVAVAVGDVNGDGYADLAVGADSHNSATGKVYVYHGAVGGIAGTTSRTLTGEAVAGFYGDALLISDADADGFSDLLVGAAYFDEGYTNRGKVYIYGSSSVGVPASSTTTWLGTDTSNGESFGTSLDF